ncbi:hypothetical protein AB0D94_32655 [Streptomyces sp. NPDC048255]|uniref:hypothetical protein n=1 Tax=Streptomyces sp. NPDC048255 TaxID=3154713 RepID=UPI0033FADD67
MNTQLIGILAGVEQHPEALRHRVPSTTVETAGDLSSTLVFPVPLGVLRLSDALPPADRRVTLRTRRSGHRR